MHGAFSRFFVKPREKGMRYAEIEGILAFFMAFLINFVTVD